MLFVHPRQSGDRRLAGRRPGRASARDGRRRDHRRRRLRRLVRPGATNRPSGLIDGDGVGIYIDTDGNPGTGSPTFTGADRVIITAGLTGPDTPPGLGTWNGTTFDFSNAALLPAVGQGGARALLDQLGVAAPGTVNVRVGTIWSGAVDSYGDFAPEVGAAPFALPLAFSTQAATPTVPVAVTDPAPTRTLPVKAGT